MINEINRKALQDPENRNLIHDFYSLLRVSDGVDLCWPITQWFFSWAYNNIGIENSMYMEIMRIIRIKYQYENTAAGFPVHFDDMHISRELFSGIKYGEKYKIIPRFDELQIMLQEAKKCTDLYDSKLFNFKFPFNYYRDELRRIEKEVIQKEGLRKEYERMKKLEEEYESLVEEYGRESAGFIWYENRRREYMKKNSGHIVMGLHDRICFYESSEEGSNPYHPECYFPFYEILYQEKDRKRLSDFEVPDILQYGSRDEWEEYKKIEIANEIFNVGLGEYDSFPDDFEAEGFDYDEIRVVNREFDDKKEELRQRDIEDHLDEEVIPYIIDLVDSYCEEMTVLDYIKEHETEEGIVFSETSDIFHSEWKDPSNIRKSLCDLGDRFRYGRRYRFRDQQPVCDKTYVVKLDTNPIGIKRLFG